jgi:hypothetical protein
MSYDDETGQEEQRECPYCGAPLKRPYWQHVQSQHGEEYAAKETWIQLYKDYAGMGMDSMVCFIVISELFNATPEEVESFLKGAGAL